MTDDAHGPGVNDVTGDDIIEADVDLLADLTPRQQLAVQGLLREHNITRVAQQAGVTERTIYNWLNTPDFARAYRRLRRDAFIQAMGLTQRFAPLAVNTLAQVMTDKAAPTHAKVTAATALLRFAREGIELDDLVARVEVLEGELAAPEEASPWA